MKCEPCTYTKYVVATLGLPFLLVLLFSSVDNVYGCSFTHSVTPGKAVDLGGFFPLTSFNILTKKYEIYPLGVQLHAAFNMAIEEINRGVIRDPTNPTQKILPNHQLAYELVDYKNDEGVGSASIAAMLGDASLDPLTIIGLANPTQTMMVQYVLRTCILPQITYSSPAAKLLPPHPSLLRTNPADVHFAMAHLSFLKYNGWTRVALINTNTLGGSAFQSICAGIAEDMYPEADFVAAEQIDLADNTLAENSRTQLVSTFGEARSKIYICHDDSVQVAIEILLFMYENGFVGKKTGNVWLLTTADFSDLYAILKDVPSLQSEEKMIDFTSGIFHLMPSHRGNFNPFMPAKENGMPVDMYSDWWLPRWRQRSPTYNATTEECDSSVDTKGQSLWKRQINPGSGEECIPLTYQEKVGVTAPYSYDAGLAAGYALHNVLHVQNKSTFTNQDLMDAYVNVNFFGATGLVQFRNDSLDKGRYVGIQYEFTNFRGNMELGFEYVGTWTSTPMNASTGKPSWDPINGYSPCNPQLYQDCVPITWTTANNSVPDDKVYCPAGTLQVGDQCVSCDRQGMDTYQDEAAQRLCKLCPDFTERRIPSPGDSISQCLCYPGYYQPQKLEGGAACVPCLEGAECSGFNPDTLTNSNPYPLEDFWSDPEYPHQIIECLAGYCDGGPNHTCGKHHFEPMGENRLCMKTARGSATISGFFVDCPDKYLGVISWIFSVGMVLLAVSLFFLVNGVLREYVPIDVFFKNVRLLAIGSSFRLRWHKNLTPCFAFFRLILFDVGIAQPNCVMDWTFFEEFLVQLLLPFLMSTFYLGPYLFKICLTWVSRGKAYSADELHSAFNQVISSCVGIFLTCYPSFATVILAALRCEEYSDGNSYLSIDANIQCFSKRHNLLFILAIICIPILIGVPFGIAWILMRGLRLKKLHLEDSLERFGSLYQRYKTNVLFWESLFLFKVLLLVSIQVFLTDVPLTQVFLSASLHLASLAAQFFARPYLNHHVNMLESVMLSIVSLFTICGTMFNDDELASYYKDSFSIIVLIVLGSGAMFAPVVAIMDVFTEVKSARAAGYLHKELLELLRNSAVDPNMECYSLRMTNALEEIKTNSNTLMTKTFMQRMKENKYGLETLKSMLTGKQSNKTSVQLLRLEEIHKTIKGGAFWVWAISCKHTIEEFDKLLALDELIAPFVSDRSETSVYSRNNTAEFWRGIIHAFPDLPNFLKMCNPKEVTEMRNTFVKLQSLGANALDRSMSSRKYYVDCITGVDVSSVVYWLCHTEPKQRTMFYELVEGVMNENGMSSTPDVMEARLHSMKSHTMVAASDLRLLDQWKSVDKSMTMARNKSQASTESQLNRLGSSSRNSNKVAPSPSNVSSD